MSQPASSYHLSEARRLTGQYQAGGPDSFGHFQELVSLLLHLTILDRYSAVRLATGPRPDTMVLGGWRGPQDPLRLTNDAFLRLSIVLYLEKVGSGTRLKVDEASYQYQLDIAGEQWIFRYDYLRNPPSPHPASHLQIRGGLTEEILPPRVLLERIHFPVGRLSLEAVIRLLIEQFGLESRERPEVWRPVLAETERSFTQIAHRVISGPEV